MSHIVKKRVIERIPKNVPEDLQRYLIVETLEKSHTMKFTVSELQGNIIALQAEIARNQLLIDEIKRSEAYNE